MIVKCIVCHSFAKKSARGLCGVCLFYVDTGLWEHIVDKEYISKKQQPETPKTEALILIAMQKIFGFNEFREGQIEATISYLNGKDTFVSMKTGGVKLYVTLYQLFVLKD